VSGTGGRATTNSRSFNTTSLALSGPANPRHVQLVLHLNSRSSLVYPRPEPSPSRTGTRPLPLISPTSESLIQPAMRPDAGPSTARVLFQPATGFASDGDDMADDDDSGDDLDLTPLAADRLRAAQLSRDVAGLFNSDSVLPDECFGSLPVRGAPPSTSSSSPASRAHLPRSLADPFPSPCSQTSST